MIPTPLSFVSHPRVTGSLSAFYLLQKNSLHLVSGGLLVNVLAPGSGPLAVASLLLAVLVTRVGVASAATPQLVEKCCLGPCDQDGLRPALSD